MKLTQKAKFSNLLFFFLISVLFKDSYKFLIIFPYAVQVWSICYKWYFKSWSFWMILHVSLRIRVNSRWPNNHFTVTHFVVCCVCVCVCKRQLQLVLSRIVDNPLFPWKCILHMNVICHVLYRYSSHLDLNSSGLSEIIFILTHAYYFVICVKKTYCY